MEFELKCNNLLFIYFEIIRLQYFIAKLKEDLGELSPIALDLLFRVLTFFEIQKRKFVFVELFHSFLGYCMNEQRTSSNYY